MRKGSHKSKEDRLSAAIREAQENPEFIKEVNKFIKAATTVHDLH